MHVDVMVCVWQT